jgi:hypothetical protein
MNSSDELLLVLIRHAHTNYTNTRCDITLKGKKALTQIAPEVQAFAQGKPITLNTSPKKRAICSCCWLGMHLDPEITAHNHVPSIDAMKLYNPERARQLLLDHRSPDDPYAVERASWNEPKFEDTTTFEPKESVKARFYRFVTQLVVSSRQKGCHVCVSHFEVIAHLVSDVFGYDFSTPEQTPIRLAEPVFLTFHRTFTNSGKTTLSSVTVDARFREQAENGVLFNYREPTRPFN